MKKFAKTMNEIIISKSQLFVFSLGLLFSLSGNAFEEKYYEPKILSDNSKVLPENFQKFNEVRRIANEEVREKKREIRQERRQERLETMPIRKDKL